MTSIKAGERYHTTTFKKGTSSNGDCELLKVADAKGKNEVTIFPSNVPSGASEGCDFVVREIYELKVGMKQSKFDQKWYQQVTVSATIEAIKSDILTDLDLEDVGELPWKEGELLEDIGLPL